MVAESLKSKATASLVRVPGSGCDSSAEGVIVDFTKVCSLAYSVQSIKDLPPGLNCASRNPPNLRHQTEKKCVDYQIKGAGVQPSEGTEGSKNQASKENHSKGNSKNAAKGEGLSLPNCKRGCSFLSPETTENQAKKRKLTSVDLQTNRAQNLAISRPNTGETTYATMPAIIQRQQNGQSYVISLPTASVPVASVMPVACTATATPVVFVNGIHVSNSPSTYPIAFIGQNGPSTTHKTTTATPQQLLQELETLKKDNGILTQRLHRYQEVFKNRDLLDALVKKLHEETS